MFQGVPSEVGFTPWVDTARARARERIEALVGAAPGTPIAWYPRDRSRRPASPAEALELLVRIGPPEAPSLELDLAPAREGARAWYVGPSLTLSYRKRRDGADPFEDAEAREQLEAIRARVEAWEAEVDRASVGALEAALWDAERLREVEDYMYRQSRPRELIVRLGFRCNQDCWFCWQGRDWPEPPAELYATWLDEAAAAGHPSVHFSGGEPTLHRSLPELIRRARRDHGMMVWLQTNAIRLAKPRYLEGLVEAGLNGVFVSYHAPDQETSDRMTRAPKTHPLTVRGLEACLTAGVMVELNCVVEAANHARLGDHARQIVERFVEPFPDNPISRVSYSHPHEYYDREAFEHAVIGLDAVRPHLVEAISVLLEAGVDVEGIGTCGFPPCLLKDQPAVLRSLVPAEEHRKDADARDFAEACDPCAIRGRCLGLRREYLERMGGQGLDPFDKSPFVGMLRP